MAWTSGRPGKRELHENMWKTSKSGQRGYMRRKMETTLHDGHARERKISNTESESNLHTFVQTVMKSDNSSAGEQLRRWRGALVSH